MMNAPNKITKQIESVIAVLMLVLVHVIEVDRVIHYNAKLMDQPGEEGPH